MNMNDTPEQIMTTDFDAVLAIENAKRRTADDLWILGRWRRDAEVGSQLTTANWELQGVFHTRSHARRFGRPGEFIAHLPFGRAPDDTVVFPDVEWM